MKKSIFILSVILTITINLFSKDIGWPYIGENWFISDSSFDVYYWGLDCADSMNCIAAGDTALDQPCIKKTTDGGLTWHTIWSDKAIWEYNDKGEPIKCLYYPNHSIRSVVYPGNGIVLGTGNKDAILFRSEDNGQHWEKIKIDSNTNSEIYRIRMYDSKSGLALMGDSIYTTDDGGKNWELLILPDSVKKPIEDAVMTDENNLKLLGVKVEWENGELIVTRYMIISEDRGKTWKIFDGPERCGRIYFFNNLKGWAPGSIISHRKNQYHSQIKYTSDGGRSWQPQLYDTLSPPIDGLNKIAIYDENYLVAIGSSEEIYTTTNGGKDWIKRSEHDTTSVEMLASLMDVSYKSFQHPLIASFVYLIYRYDEGITSVQETAPEALTLNIGPNPTESKIEINYRIDNPNAFSISVYSQLGRCMETVIENQMDIAEHTKSLDVGGYSPGVYFVVLRSGGSSVTKKFVKVE